MQPTISFHNVTSIHLEAVQHFPATEDCREFWSRVAVFTDADGKKYRVPLFSNVEGGLLTDAERAAEVRKEVLERYIESDSGIEDGLTTAAKRAVRQENPTDPSDLLTVG